MAAYLLLSVKHSPGFNGDALWWGPEESGYVDDLESAGRYEREEAERIEARTQRDAVVVPLSKAEKLSRLCVNYSLLLGHLKL